MAGPIQTSADEAQRQVLAIGAQQGDAGVQAFNDAQKQLDQIQADALARGNLQASGIQAPTTAAGEMAQLYLRPTATAKGLVTASEAAFKSGMARNSYDTVSYLQRLGAVEPMLDKYIAAKAAADLAASGGGGSGGGGSGGGGGGGSDLSDSELRVQLKGAADQSRQSDIADAAARLAAASKERTAARRLVSQASVGVHRQTKTVKRRGRKLKVVINRAKAPPRRRQQLAARYANAVYERNAARTKLGGLRRNAQATARTQRRAYADLVQTGHAPLEDYARAIGIEAGEDPNRVAGLIGPTEAASLRNADKNRDAAAGGNVGLFGRAPTLGPRAAAKEIKVPTAKAKVMRTSPRYRDIAAQAEAYLAKGKTLGEFQREIGDPWRKPFTTQAKNKKGKKVDVKHKGYSHLVDLVLLDYGPSFGK